MAYVNQAEPSTNYTKATEPSNVVTDFLQKEDNDLLLQENGDKIVLTTGASIYTNTAEQATAYANQNEP